MYEIAGFYNPHDHYLKEKIHYETVLADTAGRQRYWRPDDSGLYLAEHGGLSHARLSTIDLSGGRQPMVKSGFGQAFTIVYSGEPYNTEELRQDLIRCGRSFQTSSDTEVILTGYMEYGPEFAKQLNDIFALAILDTAKNWLCLFRDRSGVKPLSHMVQGQETIFASGPKGILAHPGTRPRPNKKGLDEIFSIGPARTYGCGVFKDMEELLPGHFLICFHNGLCLKSYRKLESHLHEDSYEEIVEGTSFLVQDAVCRQMVSDVPICTFPSGGVDSSLASAICAAQLRKQGRKLTIFSLDSMDNDKYSKANSLQPSQDRPLVGRIVQFLDSDHHYLEYDNLTRVDRFYDSALAHDLPAMGGIDSSMLQFCSMVKEYNKVALTGECADKIFGGYPWFHEKECFEAHTFPWTIDLNARKILFDDNFLEYLDTDDYIKNTYERSMAETPVLAKDMPVGARRREIAYLNPRWFMQTLLNRMDRVSMYSGLETRVLFADHGIIEYVWNVPWDIKTRDGVVKNLLRQSTKGLLFEDIPFRCKSPYPKTYDISYEKLLVGRVRETTSDSHAPVMQFLDRKKLELFLSNPGDYGRPWCGQLMAGPQMMAYILQINFWMRTYDIELTE